jgi:hypothetical protein
MTGSSFWWTGGEVMVFDGEFVGVPELVGVRPESALESAREFTRSLPSWIGLTTRCTFDVSRCKMNGLECPEGFKVTCAVEILVIFGIGTGFGSSDVVLSKLFSLTCRGESVRNLLEIDLENKFDLRIGVMFETGEALGLEVTMLELLGVEV